MEKYFNTKKIAGPVFLARLIKNKKIIYLFGDIHHPSSYQTECHIKENTMYLNQYLNFIFHTNKKKKINIFLETPKKYGEHIYTQKFYQSFNGIYIVNMRRFFHSKEVHRKFKNVNFIAFDERLEQNKPLSKLSFNSLNLMNLEYQLTTLIKSFFVVLFLVILYKVLHSAKVKNNDSNEKNNILFNIFYYIYKFILINIVVFYLIISLLTIILYFHQKKILVRNKILLFNDQSKNSFTKRISESKFLEVRNEYKQLLSIIRESNDPTVLFTSCSSLIDLYHIDLFLKEDVNLNYSYSGLFHTEHIMHFLINKCKFKLTHCTNSNLFKDYILTESKKYDIEDFILKKDNINPFSLFHLNNTQCIDISTFPPNLT